MRKSESIKELAAALCKFQAVVDGAKKTSNNPFYKSKYADLGTIWETIRQPLTDNGLAVIQTTEASESGLVCVETVLTHSSGEWVSGSLTLKMTKDDPQGAGSAITYARRYGLAAILGIHQEDDDAETHRKPAKSRPEGVGAIAKQCKEAIDSSDLGKAQKAHYTKAMDVAVMQGDFFTLQDIIQKIKHPTPAAETDDAEVHEIKMDISEIIKSLISEGVEGYGSESRRKNSFQKHLGTDTLKECNDLEKLMEYRQYLTDKLRGVK